MKNKRVWSVILLIAFLCIGCGKSPEQQIAEQQELGQKYLIEENYEQAIVAFSKVIELDKKNVDAYLNLSEVYLMMDDKEMAKQILEIGIGEIANERLQVKWEEVSELLDSVDNVADETAYNETDVLREDMDLEGESVVEAESVKKIQRSEAAMLSHGYFCSFGLREDGTVLVAGTEEHNQHDVTTWTDIVQISAQGNGYVFGLKANGTVVMAGENSSIDPEGTLFQGTENWTDIAYVSAGGYQTAGLKNDGTVVSAGRDDDGQGAVSSWTDIRAISSGTVHSVGMKSDGTVIAAGCNCSGECDVLDWTDVAGISAGHHRTIGLKADGSVVAVGDNSHSECDVSDWSDIIAVSGDSYNTVGLKLDGTVMVAGSDLYGGHCSEARAWKDIIAISCSGDGVIGLKADGTVVGTEYSGRFNYGQMDVSSWSNIMLPTKE